MKKIKLLFSALLLTTSFTFALAVPAGVVDAQAKQQICEGLGGPADCDPGGSASSVNKLIRTVISFLSFIVGIVSVIMIIIGGLKYITSSGDSSNVTSAKNTILYAIVGLVVVALAQVLVRFVLNTAA